MFLPFYRRVSGKRLIFEASVVASKMASNSRATAMVHTPLNSITQKSSRYERQWAWNFVCFFDQIECSGAQTADFRLLYVLNDKFLGAM